MKIYITSQNEAKVNAVKNVFRKIFNEAEFIAIKVNSGVSVTPTTDDEALKGCINRIEAVKRQIELYDAIVSMEGLVSKNSYGSFVYGWAAIDFFRCSKLAIGCSAKVMLPEDIAEQVSNNIELSEIIKARYNDISAEQMERWGTNGIITNGLYTRVNEFEDALLCAIGSVIRYLDF
ncbi:inosine/xanthosine triphosphatase [Acetivibrio clariflavus]|uniref:inosine/xanthosine triphosphatase n=1 Tax=Acetivibrio clariflavus (strain DSM 19732 / NBRC 101661 / EBR45) TaxID=720554 RepID=G8LTU2_ACECE|nr:inosine/xanthosine triphosphatase [Acetivibrio clariflavus]AEV67288.1 hypothetical protein Clocl_0577 [Acetivibrio clariflavus DSM 19732]